MEKISWTDRLRIDILQRVNEGGVEYLASNKEKEG
jgi:hypothetical protein